MIQDPLIHLISAYTVIDLPTTREDLQRLIDEGVPESLTLDYKDSRALEAKQRNELSKDVSAFANSAGGVLIYGIRERDNLPLEIDSGISNAALQRETLEHVLTSKIAPRVEGVVIRQIPLDDAHSAYVIGVPQSFRAPHQDREKHIYYKRHNFKCAPMEDYEIADLRARASLRPRLVSFDIVIEKQLIFFVIRNVGLYTATNVNFGFSEELTWEAQPPGIIVNGIESLPPGREYRFLYGATFAIFDQTNPGRSDFDVDVMYDHPGTGTRVVDQHRINLRDFLGTWPAADSVQEAGDNVAKKIDALTGQLKEMNNHLSILSRIAAPSGLTLRVPMLRTIFQTLGLSFKPAPIDPLGRSHSFYEDVLGVDFPLSYRIARHFSQGRSHAGLENIEGMTPEIIQQIRESFYGSE